MSFGVILHNIVHIRHDIFEFKEDDSIEEYLKIAFFGVLNLTDEDFSILRGAMEEVRENSRKEDTDIPLYRCHIE